MKRSYLLLLSSLLAAPAAHANDFPTSSRVEYVLECMQRHDSKYEYLYKCSCVIDEIAKAMKHEEYLEMSTALRNQTMAGERGAVFRDPPSVKEMASKYKAIQAEAHKACNVPQR
jgi:lysyl-tRNA synthetase class II